MKLHAMKAELLQLNDVIGNLQILLNRSRRLRDRTPAQLEWERRATRKHELSLLRRVRLEAEIRLLEDSTTAAFAMAFLDTARTYGDAAEVARLEAITRRHIEQELTACAK